MTKLLSPGRAGNRVWNTRERTSVEETSGLLRRQAIMQKAVESESLLQRVVDAHNLLVVIEDVALVINVAMRIEAAAMFAATFGCGTLP